MDLKPVQAATADTPIVAEPFILSVTAGTQAESPLQSRSKSVVFYGLLLFGTLFPIVGTIIGLIRK